MSQCRTGEEKQEEDGGDWSLQNMDTLGFILDFVKVSYFFMLLKIS